MKKKLAFLCSIFSLFSIETVPPELFWDYSCWNESVFLLLRNIRPLTENLIRKKDNFFNDELANTYQALLKLTPDAKTRKLIEKDVKKYQQTACKTIKSTNKWGELTVFLHELLVELSSISSQYLNILTGNGLLIQRLTLNTCKYNNSIKETLDKLNNHILSLSEFIILMPLYSDDKDLSINIPLELDMGPYLKEQITFEKPIKFQTKKTQPDTWVYELISVVTDTGKHSEVYIKDQFELDPAWYYCHGLGSTPKKLSSKDVINDIAHWEIKKNGFIDALLYKKINKQSIEPNNNTSVNQFASALENIASKK